MDNSQHQSKSENPKKTAQISLFLGILVFLSPSGSGYYFGIIGILGIIHSINALKKSNPHKGLLIAGLILNSIALGRVLYNLIHDFIL